MSEAVIMRSPILNNNNNSSIQPETDKAIVLVTAYKSPTSPQRIINARINTYYTSNNVLAISGTTNENGQCLFKIPGAKYRFAMDEGFVDLVSSNITQVLSNNNIYELEMNREFRPNDYSIVYTNNTTIKFSDAIDNVNVTCIGGGGGSATPSAKFGFYTYMWGSSGADMGVGYSGVNIYNGQAGGNGFINSSIIKINNSNNININIGNCGNCTNFYNSGSSWGETIYIHGKYGSAGGATFFGNYLSANGGSGGCINTINSSTYQYEINGGNGIYNYGRGGNESNNATCTGTGRMIGGGSYYGNYYGNNGNNGAVILSNFNYKI